MRIVIPTQKTTEDYQQTNEYKCLHKIKYGNSYLGNEGCDYPIFDCMKYETEIDIVEKNTKGLCKLYNEFLYKDDWMTHPDNTANDDIILFMHDDVEIHDLFLYEKLKKAHEIYDIVGLAGATKQVYTQDKPCLWHTCCDNFRNGQGDGKGFVAHQHPTGITSDYYGISPSEVAVIDGLFMSVNAKRLREVGFKFDEDFTFHHYDLKTCLDAKKLGLKIGVWPIFVIHKGLGHWNSDELWHTSDKKFKEKLTNE
jgi:Glycosyltransferase like family